MKILRISHLFDSNSSQVKNALLHRKMVNGSEPLKVIKEMGFDVVGSISEALETLGYEVSNIYFDLQEFQKQWALEKGINTKRKNWLSEVLFEQIKLNRPDILFVQKPCLTISKTLEKVKKEIGCIKKIIVHSVYGGNTADYGYADILLIGTPKLVKKYSQLGYKPYLFYYYFDRKLAFFFNNLRYEKSGFSFAGSTGFGHGYAHASRYWLLNELLQKNSLEIWENVVSFQKPKMKDIFREWLKAKIKFYLNLKKINPYKLRPNMLRNLIIEVQNEIRFYERGIKLPLKSLQEIYPHKCHPGLFGLQYYEQIAKSKLCLHRGGDNTHDDLNNQEGNAGALRMFEVTGLGTCLLTESASNNRDLFEPDHEIFTYGSTQEAIEKSNYLLNNPAVCEEVAIRGQKKCLKFHSAENRAEQLHEIIRNSL